jgi:hypothetical protein
MEIGGAIFECASQVGQECVEFLVHGSLMDFICWVSDGEPDGLMLITLIYQGVSGTGAGTEYF